MRHLQCSVWHEDYADYENLFRADEPDSIQRFVTGSNEPSRPPMMKDLQLKSVSAF